MIAPSVFAIGRRFLTSLCLLLLGAVLLVEAAEVRFTDCLNYDSVSTSLYFLPNRVESSYVEVTDSSDRTLHFEIFGTMTGQLQNLDDKSSKYSTLRSQLSALQYPIYDNYSKLCEAAESCPFGPGNTSFSYEFGVSSAYQGIAFNAKFVILDPSQTAQVVGCIEASVMPIIEDSVWFILVFVVLGITVLVGATFFLTVSLNPWTGTKNMYIWSSNYGADSSVIRLITPGYFDIMKYLQYTFFLGCLSLDYPAFLQPIISVFSWSCLFFTSSLISSSTGNHNDGLFNGNALYGLERMSQINQVPHAYDVWAGFILYLLCIGAAVLLICEFIAVSTWAWKKYKQDTSDLRNRNLSFIYGIGLKLSHHLFALPLITFSFFQCILTNRGGGPVYLSILSTLVLVAWILIAIYICRHLSKVNPRQALYDDMATLLRYGTFYNTYNEHGSIFFVVELTTTFFRGMTFGAIQMSGLAQIILLAVIELFYFFCILIIKPYDSETSMNLISSLFTVLRFMLIFLSLPFLESLNIDLVVRQWLGYVILILHGLVVLLFLMHGIQVIVEVLLRNNGVVTQEHTGAIYSLKQLSRRKRTAEAIPLNDSKSYMSAPVDEHLRHHHGASIDGRTMLLSEDVNTIGGLSPVANSKNALSPLVIQQVAPALLPTGGTARDSYHDEYMSSPISRNSFMLDENSNRNSGGYYRKPRRRGSSHDMGSPTANSSSDAERDPDYRIGLVSPPPKGVDYAVRESDVYYTKSGQRELKKKRKHFKRKQKNSSVDSVEDLGTQPAQEEHTSTNSYDYGPYVGGDLRYSAYEALPSSEITDSGGVLTGGGSESKRRSRNPNSMVGLLDHDASGGSPMYHYEYDPERHSSTEMRLEDTGFAVNQQGHKGSGQANDSSKNKIMNWFKEKRNSLFFPNKNYFEEDALEPRGFEVLRRGPIIPYKSTASSDSESESDSASVSASVSASGLESESETKPVNRTYDSLADSHSSQGDETENLLRNERSQVGVSNQIPATQSVVDNSVKQIKLVSNSQNEENQDPYSGYSSMSVATGVPSQVTIGTATSGEPGEDIRKIDDNVIPQKQYHRRRESYVESPAGTFVFPTLERSP